MLGDQADLARGVEALDEARDDTGDHAFEALVPAVLGGVQGAVALDDPAEVAGAVRAQHDGGGARGLGGRGVGGRGGDPRPVGRG
ncbi:MAG: hypothetical protein O9345_24825, partial [Burkholderiaceae bacterium]|nr:hypothetical protein [Burkholderiaceae bacterium]